MPRDLHGSGFPDSTVVTNPPTNAGDTGSIPGLGRSPGGGNGTPLQYSCLENPTDRGAWQARVQDHKAWDTTEYTCTLHGSPIHLLSLL